MDHGLPLEANDLSGMKFIVPFENQLFIAWYSVPCSWWANGLQSTPSYTISLMLISASPFHTCLYLPSGFFPFHVPWINILMHFSSLASAVRGLRLHLPSFYRHSDVWREAIAWRTQYDKTQRISFGVHWYNFLFYFACYISIYFSCLFIHAVTINWYSSEHIMPLVHDCHRVWKFVFLIAKYLKCLQLRMEELVDLLSLQAALRRYRCAKWNK